MRRFVFVVCTVALPFTFALNGFQPQDAPGVWVQKANMATARSGACAAALPDGRVLITGGVGPVGALDSVELITGGTASAAASMSAARSEHICVTLQDGRVLVAGGLSNAGQITGAEIYDPESNRWSAAGDMAYARSGHTATVLNDGRVLISGGAGPGTAVHNTLELFDPASNTFRFVSSGVLSSPRKSHAAALLADGRVLIAGGSDGAVSLASTDVFDPAAGTVDAGPQMLAARAGLSATSLLDGSILIAGGNDGKQNLASTEIFSATAARFEKGSVMGSPRSGHLAVLLPHNNQVLLAGGDETGRSAELYTPWLGAFRSTGSLLESRSGAAGSPASEGTFVVAGGRAGNQSLGSSSLYHFPTVRTDKDQYAPGAPINIIGSGWRPSDKLSVLVQEKPKQHDDRTLTTTSDTAGNFTAQYQETQHPASNFMITVNGSGLAAQASASTNPAANLNQCADGANLTPAGQMTTTCSWVNGNVNGTKATYFEGDSLPYQVIMTGLAAGTNSLTIQWDTTQSGKHALDYITSFNRTVLLADPCVGSGLSTCNKSLPSSTFAIPADPNVLSAGVTPVSGSNFAMWNGNITGVSPYTITGTYTSSSSTSITITFNAPANNSTVVLAWGGHISSRLDWGAGTSAVGISGSPYHTRLVSLSQTSVGNQDRALSADAVVFPGSITVIKQASPANGSTFNYTAGPSPLSNFSLTVDGTSNNTKTFSNITTFTTYTVAETVPTANWAFQSLNCTVGVGGLGTTTFSYSGTTATINLKEGDPVTCTYTNVPNSHKVTLTKTLSPTSDPGKFDLSVNSTTTTNQGNGGSAQATGVPVFSTVTVGEAATAGTNTSLSNYTSTLSCSTAAGAVTFTSGGTTSGRFVMPDADVTCSLTNTRAGHKVTLTKNVVPSTETTTFSVRIDDGDATPATGSISNGLNIQKTITGGLSVTVSESGTNLANYTSTLSCTANATNLTPNATTSGTFTMPDADVACTLTNTRKSYKVTLTKSLSPSNDGGTFILTAATKSSSPVGDGGSVQDTVVGGTTNVSVSESAASGTVLANYSSSLSCTTAAGALASGTTSASFTMPDSDVSCTATNTRKTHSVTLTKTIVPSGDVGRFDLTVNGTTAPNQTTAGTATATNVPVGSTVNVSEAASAGTNTSLASYSSVLVCAATGGANLTPLGTSSGSFTMPDANVSCSLTNTRSQHQVTLTKHVVPQGDTATFPLSIADNYHQTAATGTRADGGSIAATIYGGASVTVSETSNSLYTASLSCSSGVTVVATGTSSAGFTMPDADVTCSLTNTRQTGTLRIAKICAPTTDTSTSFGGTITAVTGGAVTQFPSVVCGQMTTSYTLPTGSYTVAETSIPAGWVQGGSVSTVTQGTWAAPGTFSGDCNSAGSVTLNTGDSKTCYILNVSSVCTPGFSFPATPPPGGSSAMPVPATAVPNRQRTAPRPGPTTNPSRPIRK